MLRHALLTLALFLLATGVLALATTAPARAADRSSPWALFEFVKNVETAEELAQCLHPEYGELYLENAGDEAPEPVDAEMVEIRTDRGWAALYAVVIEDGDEAFDGFAMQRVEGDWYIVMPYWLEDLDAPDWVAEQIEDWDRYYIGPFPDYEPKDTPDTIYDYRPALLLNPDLEAPNPPEATLESLREILDLLAYWSSRAIDGPGEWREGNVILGAPPEEYVPSDAELMASYVGGLVQAIIDGNERADVASVLDQAGMGGGSSVTYGHIDIWHADVMGSGRFFYASHPEDVTIPLPAVGD